MNFYGINRSNYKKKLTDPIDREIWEFACLKIGMKSDYINNTFEFAYKIHPFTKKRRLLILYSDRGLLSIILLKKKWADFVYNLDMSRLVVPKLDMTEISNVFADTFDVKDKQKFVWTNMETIESIKVLPNLDFDTVIANHGCGSLTDIAINFAIAVKKDIISVGCCYHKIKEIALKEMFNEYGWEAVFITRQYRLKMNGYNTRVTKITVKKIELNEKDDDIILIGYLSKYKKETEENDEIIKMYKALESLKPIPDDEKLKLSEINEILSKNDGDKENIDKDHILYF